MLDFGCNSLACRQHCTEVLVFRGKFAASVSLHKARAGHDPLNDRHDPAFSTHLEGSSRREFCRYVTALQDVPLQVQCELEFTKHRFRHSTAVEEVTVRRLLH